MSATPEERKTLFNDFKRIENAWSFGPGLALDLATDITGLRRDLAYTGYPISTLTELRIELDQAALAYILADEKALGQLVDLVKDGPALRVYPSLVDAQGHHQPVTGGELADVLALLRGHTTGPDRIGP